MNTKTEPLPFEVGKSVMILQVTPFQGVMGTERGASSPCFAWLPACYRSLRQELQWFKNLVELSCYKLKKLYVLCKTLSTLDGPMSPGLVGLRACGAHRVQACGTCFTLDPSDPTWVGVCRTHRACFTLGRHGFRWVGPLWAVRAVIYDPALESWHKEQEWIYLRTQQDIAGNQKFCVMSSMVWCVPEWPESGPSWWAEITSARMEADI